MWLLVLAVGALILPGCFDSEEPEPTPTDGKGLPRSPEGDLYLSDLLAPTSCAEPPRDLFLSRDGQGILGYCQKLIGQDEEGFPLIQKIFLSCPLDRGVCEEIVPSEEGFNHPDNADEANLFAPLRPLRRNHLLEVSPGILVSLFQRYVDDEVTAGVTLTHQQTGEETTFLLSPVDISGLALQDQSGRSILQFAGMLPSAMAFKESTSELFILVNTYQYGKDLEALTTPAVLYRYQLTPEGALEYRTFHVIRHSYRAANMTLVGPDQDLMLILNEWSDAEPTYQRNNDGSILLDEAGKPIEGERILLVSITVTEDGLENATVIIPTKPIRDALRFTEDTILKALPNGAVLMGDIFLPFADEPTTLYLMDPYASQPEGLFSEVPIETPTLVTGIAVYRDILYLTDAFGFTDPFRLMGRLSVSRLDQTGIVVRPDCDLKTDQSTSLDPILGGCLEAATLNVTTPDGLLVVGMRGFLAAHRIDAAGFAGPPDN